MKSRSICSKRLAASRLLPDPVKPQNHGLVVSNKQVIPVRATGKRNFAYRLAVTDILVAGMASKKVAVERPVKELA